MASRSEDLPDPVGPLMANTSSPVKSSSTGSRKAVNPRSSSRTGRTASALLPEVLEDLVERPGQLRGGRVDAVRLAVVGGELLPGIQRGERPALRLDLDAFVSELDVDGVRQGVPDPPADPGDGAVGVDERPQV